MTSRDFCYWLQGYFELRNGKGSGWSAEQAAMVERHLSLVFKHEIDPSAGGAAHQDELNKIHRPEPILNDPTHNWDDADVASGSGEVLYRC